MSLRFSDIEAYIAFSPHEYIIESISERCVRLRFELVLNGKKPRIPRTKRGTWRYWRTHKLGKRGEVVEATAVVGVDDYAMFYAHLFVNGQYAFEHDEDVANSFGEYTARAAVKQLERVISQVSLPIQSRAV